LIEKAAGIVQKQGFFSNPGFFFSALLKDSLKKWCSIDIQIEKRNVSTRFSNYFTVNREF